MVKRAFILQLLYGKNQSESVLESPDMLLGNSTDPQLYLASGSPRRRYLLTMIKLVYNPLPAQVDESPLPNENGKDYVKRIAASKALVAARQAQANGVVIAADTTVIDNGMNAKLDVLGKPKDPTEAASMLHRLRGHVHHVLTALTILRKEDGKMLNDLCSTDVPMRNYSDEEIEAYVSSGDPMDKAGAYAIQHPGFHPVEKLNGCYANVMGLPLCHLTRNLTLLSISVNVDVPQICQATLRHDCPAYQGILSDKNWVAL